MSTISKKVYRRKIKKISLALQEAIRISMTNCFLNDKAPVSEWKVAGVRVDEENSSIIIDVLVKPAMPRITFKMSVDETGVNFVND